MALGASYLTTERTDDAVALYRGCLERVSAQEPRSRPAAVRYATSLGHALIEAGEIDEAREALAIAFAYGRSVADTDAAARPGGGLLAPPVEGNAPVVGIRYSGSQCPVKFQGEREI